MGKTLSISLECHLANMKLSYLRPLAAVKNPHYETKKPIHSPLQKAGIAQSIFVCQFVLGISQNSAVS